MPGDRLIVKYFLPVKTKSWQDGRPGTALPLVAGTVAFWVPSPLQQWRGNINYHFVRVNSVCNNTQGKEKREREKNNNTHTMAVKLLSNEPVPAQCWLITFPPNISRGVRETKANGASGHSSARYRQMPCDYVFSPGSTSSDLLLNPNRYFEVMACHRVAAKCRFFFCKTL